MHSIQTASKEKEKLLDLTNPNVFIFNIASQIIRLELNGSMNVYPLSTKDLSVLGIPGITIIIKTWHCQHSQRATHFMLSGFVLSAWDTSVIISPNASFLIHRSRRKCSLERMIILVMQQDKVKPWKAYSICFWLSSSII